MIVSLSLITNIPLPTIGRSIGDDAPLVFRGAPRKTSAAAPGEDSNGTIGEYAPVLTGQVVADHVLCQGRRQRIVDRSHFVGVTGAEGSVRTAPLEMPPATLLRPLAEYEAVVGGGW
ncbi:hypothetical conserved protein (plasmid) [Rhizobium etli CFN 42]|uniref:Hypothetical conserved protein n=1 Tax=Rhizobium etli (strain ATCC 51251 / DSM 11541 / JCM 21823 / NBRC 15573 / CFN 42) TaxID=347834 RepID=Q2K2G4_RHIEC|nr:hypothetical conserved protein [Rhizobium etli CFN 42]